MFRDEEADDPAERRRDHGDFAVPSWSRAEPANAKPNRISIARSATRVITPSANV